MRSWLKVILVSIAFCGAGVLQAQTWVCEVEAAVGFSSNKGYQPLRFDINKSYVLKKDIEPEDLTLPLHRKHVAFSSKSTVSAPASLQQNGDKFVEFCHVIAIPGGATLFTCESGYYGDKFIFNMNTGKFSHVFAGFELTNGGASFVEVGSCRQTN